MSMKKKDWVNYALLGIPSLVGILTSMVKGNKKGVVTNIKDTPLPQDVTNVVNEAQNSIDKPTQTVGGILNPEDKENHIDEN